MNDTETLKKLKEILNVKVNEFESIALNSFSEVYAIRNMAKISIIRQILNLIDLLAINKEVDLI